MTTPSSWSEVKELLADALELAQSQRAEFLDGACAGRPEIRREVEGLLARQPLGDPFSTLKSHADSAPDRIGPWKLVRVLGRGGMGTVWLAERHDGELQQRCAIKLLRRGVDTADVVRRFRAERQILANLSHPYIARLLDGGSTEDGRPYVALELVDGEPIDEWCDQRRLDIDSRLRLFLKVCEAVAHAHRHLVVHRDLKPSNVLVAADGTPKLVDFGIAKMLGADEPDLTRSVDRPMTIRYASPEQMRGAAIGTATDVHGLGLLLYELLSGRRAFEVDGLSAIEASRVICETEVTPPSVAVARGLETLPTADQIAASRQSESRLLVRRLSGDLDRICQRALEKEPKQRFPSVERFADDINRHLQGLPLESRPGSQWTRTLKLARRHRGAVAGAAGLVLTLSAFAATMTVQRGRLAVESERARAEANAALQARREAEDTVELLLSLFEADEVGSARVEPEAAREILAQGAKRIRRDLADRPLDRAKVLETISRAYANLGLLAEAEELAREALTTSRGVVPADDERLSRPLLQLASVLNLAARPKEAVEILDQALHLAGPRDPRTAALIRRELGTARAVLGQHDVAIADLEAAVGAFEDLDGPASAEVATTLHHLGGTLAAANRLDQAEAAYARALEISVDRYGPDHRRVATLLRSRGALARARGNYQEANELLTRVLTILEATAGPDHPDVAAVLSNLAFLELREGGDYPRAERLLERSLAIGRASVGSPSLAVAATIESLGNLRVWQKRFEEAEALLVQALEMREEILGPEHHTVGMTLANIGYALADSDRCERAIPYLERARELNERVLGHQHFLVAGPIAGLGSCLMQAGKIPEARRAFIEAQAILDAIGISPSHRAYQTLVEQLERATTAPAPTRSAPKEPL